MLYFYGVMLGLESLAKGRFSREALKNIIVPENYWRTLEFRLAYEELHASSADRILDVGSPKLLSMFLAERTGAEVYATDIESYFVRDYSSFREQRKIPDSRLHILEADGRKLPFPDGHFTRTYSISVLEHIPGNGDTECVRELARTLRKGGICVITVPFAPESRDEFMKSDAFYWSSKSEKGKDPAKTFFQRRYSEEDLHERLVRPSGLTLRKTEYLGDRVALGNGSELANFFPPFAGPLHPLLSRLFHEKPSGEWRKMKKPLGALLVLEKA